MPMFLRILSVRINCERRIMHRRTECCQEACFLCPESKSLQRETIQPDMIASINITMRLAFVVACYVLCRPVSYLAPTNIAK
jgi:hypothetical protein